MFQRQEECLLRRTYFMEMHLVLRKLTLYKSTGIKGKKKLTVRDSATCYLCDFGQVTSLPHNSVSSPCGCDSTYLTRWLKGLNEVIFVESLVLEQY